MIAVIFEFTPAEGRAPKRRRTASRCTDNIFDG